MLTNEPGRGSRVGPPYDVAFVVAPGAELVDIAGPWGVFEYATSPTDGRSPFALSLVAETTEPLVLSGGMRVVPNSSFAECRQPDIVVVPAMGLDTVGEELLDWLRRVHPTATLTMSVCNGAFVLAEAGLLDRRSATCHHGAYSALRAMYPSVTVRRGMRWVDEGHVATAGGLTSGTDLALHIVERLLGADVAERAAAELEHLGDGWKDPTLNAPFADPPPPPPGRVLDPICGMAVDPAESINATWDGRDFSFCAQWCHDTFLANPGAFDTIN